MAVTKVPASVNSVGVVLDTVIAATAERDVNGGATHVLAIVIANPNAAEDAHFKMYDNVAPTIGTTDPEFILFVPRNKTTVYIFGDGECEFTTALSYALVTQAGTAGTTAGTGSYTMALIHTST